jgi:hypothetical protein
MAKYSVERTTRLTGGATVTEYAIYRSGDGELVHGDDPVLMHRIVDLLNSETADVTLPEQVSA